MTTLVGTTSKTNNVKTNQLNPQSTNPLTQVLNSNANPLTHALSQVHEYQVTGLTWPPLAMQDLRCYPLSSTCAPTGYSGTRASRSESRARRPPVMPAPTRTHPPTAGPRHKGDRR